MPEAENGDKKMPRKVIFILGGLGIRGTYKKKKKKKCNGGEHSDFDTTDFKVII